MKWAIRFIKIRPRFCLNLRDHYNPFSSRETRQHGQGAPQCVLPVIRRKPEDFSALELIDEAQGDVLIGLVRGGLDAVVHAKSEITFFKLQSGHA